ncbi:mandelate racemase/muconate lactonizing enzyme family protein [Sabulilitoribacter arenilitoris]|uniref:Mandelate racemase/muconate lactonizing enzyme family protein n=1 Tax=Wocania arenilitoris TaxID=2044858 RepID=A0AAE3ENQ3_9FLAO|nr:mandelate racemase/muconate lactonizing enzyme family protein [Wocania arenilitoris]MCF7568816.1 mandelate racemase/muconate lactonizing enzyme family protein [Wocania arenilitoris]
MKNTITKIESFYVRVPLGRPLKLGAIEIPDRHYVIVRIYDEAGNVGTSYGLSRNAPVAEVVHNNIIPIWKGKSLDNHEELYNLTTKANVCLGTNGIFFRALSLFDCALYDLLAIREKQPLYKYLGGESKAIPTMLVGGYPTSNETEETLADEMELYATYNPAGVKIASTTDAFKDGERLRTCRKYLPMSIPLMIDCVWGQTDAKTYAVEVQKWEDLNMKWIEDPFLTDDYENIRYLSENTKIDIAVGDEQSGYLNMLRLMDQGKVNVLRLDATVCGGVRTFIKIAKAAYQRGIPVACHVFHQLHLHLACAVPGVDIIEYMLPESDIESYQRLWDNDLVLENGTFTPTENPGVGTAWNEEFIIRYKE